MKMIRILCQQAGVRLARNHSTNVGKLRMQPRRIFESVSRGESYGREAGRVHRMQNFYSRYLHFHFEFGAGRQNTKIHQNAIKA